MNQDTEIRNAIFVWLENQVATHGIVLPRRPLLENGFYHKGVKIPLVSATGIFKPKALDYPISLSTTPKGPYSDSIQSNEVLSYSYRGTDPTSWDNVALKRSMIDHVPLVYFLGLVTNRYLATWPVYIIGADDDALMFTVSLFECNNEILGIRNGSQAIGSDISKEYAQRIVLQRIHQHKFRERVLEAYQSSCSFCDLKHRELLDAAHIIPDNEPNSPQAVSNGLALCKLHHAAFDSLFVGVSPDYIISVRDDILQESDGPVLLHGLQNMHGKKLVVPRNKDLRPNPEFLEWRYSKFIKAG